MLKCLLQQQHLYSSSFFRWGAHPPHHRHAARRAAGMSRLVWMYHGEAEEKQGEQCVLVGDTVVDDVFGNGKAVRTAEQVLVHRCWYS